MKKQMRILIVDDNEMMVKTLQDIFKVKGYQAETAYSGSEALKKMEHNNFDCVLSDIKMPDLNGVELYRAIKAQQPGLPVVLMTAYAIDKLVEESLDEGVVATLTKPLNLDLLLNFLTSLHQERSIVIMDDDPDFCRTLGDILRVQDFSVTQVTDPNSLLDQLQPERQVVLLDMKLNQFNGLDILRQIKQRHPHLPVILVTGYRDEMMPAIETGLKINAHTYFYKPFQIEKLLRVLIQVDHQELGRKLGRLITQKG